MMCWFEIMCVKILFVCFVMFVFYVLVCLSVDLELI